MDVSDKERTARMGQRKVEIVPEVSKNTQRTSKSSEGLIMSFTEVTFSLYKVLFNTNILLKHSGD